MEIDGLRLYPDRTRAVSAGELYYNTTAALRSGRTYADTSFQQIFGQSAKGGQRAGSQELSSSLDTLFEEAAHTYQVDVNLLKAIGKAESGFDPGAVSHAGAIGVMQLMPATASSLGVSDPYDAKENIMGGASYIAGLLRQYNGDVSLALAAYNAGSGNVAKYGGIPPFSETQAYVKKVMEYAGQEIAVNQTVPRAAAVPKPQGEDMQAGLAGYWGHIVDLMRIQLEMKLSNILSSGEEDGGRWGI